MLRATRHSRGASRSTHGTKYRAFWSSSCAIPPAASRSCSHHVLLANAKVPLKVFLRLRDLMDHPRWLLLLCQFALESSRILNRGARTEILKLENLAKLDLAFCCFAVRRGAVLGPVDRFFFRVDLDQPIAGDQVLGLGERAFNDGGLSAGEFDARALRAGLQACQIQQDSGLCHFLVVLRHRGNQPVVRHRAGFGILAGLDQHHESHRPVLLECHIGAKRTAATGGSRASGIVHESPPSSDIHKPPLVEPKASRSPLSSTPRPWRQTKSYA